MTGSGPVGVGFIGTGMISDTYLDNLTSFPDVRVVILGDLDPARARTQAGKHGVPEWGSSADVLAHPEVEIVVNLTIPAVHAQVASQAIAAGKNVWSEKPISIDRESGQALLEQAARRGCSSASRRTPSSDPGCSRRDEPSRTATSVSRCPPRPSCNMPGRTCSTPTPSSCSPGVPARCSTWAPTT